MATQTDLDGSLNETVSGETAAPFDIFARVSDLESETGDIVRKDFADGTEGGVLGGVRLEHTGDTSRYRLAETVLSVYGGEPRQVETPVPVASPEDDGFMTKEQAALLERTDENLAQEITDRAGADDGLQNQIDVGTANLAQEVADREAADGGLAQKINAVKGRGGYLMACDFGTHTPTQDDLDAYALSQIHSDDPQDIWNGTHVKNIYADPGTGIPDSHVWALTNTPDTDPPIHDWSDDGFDSVSEFSNDFAGVLQGTADPGDGSKDGFITAVGKFAKVIGEIAYKDFLYQVGDYYTQYPDTKTPAERGLPGSWEIWSNRAVIYGLSTSSGGSTGAYIERQKCGNPLADSDLSAGQQLASGPYAGWYVTEVVTPAGKFWGVDGGNRPAFVSGGPQGDRIRNITGGFVPYSDNLGGLGLVEQNAAWGAFLPSGKATGTVTRGQVATVDGRYYGAAFDSARVVPVGADNAPANLSTRIWRRVS